MVAEETAEHLGSVKFCPAIAAQHRFDQMLEQVERGETVLIHKEGRVVAQFSPPTVDQRNVSEASANTLRFFEEVAELKKGRPTNVTREEILAWRHEGHKW